VILISSRDAALRETLTNELESAGFRVTSWEPGEAVGGDVSLLIIDGLEGVVEAHDVRVHILALVDSEEVGLFPECPRKVTGFALKPPRAGEVLARVKRIHTIPPWREQSLQRLLAFAVETTSDVIQVTTPDTELEYVNPAYETAIGIPRDEVLGKTPAELERSDHHPPEFYQNIEETLERGETWSGTIISKHREGKLIHFDSVIAPISDSKGAITHHMAVKRDVTERLARRQALLHANRALESARDVAVAASRAKSEFLANISHELRTPLNAIIGYSEMLKEELEDAGEQTQQDLERIRASGTNLLSLIDDVLDLSKLEADRVELNPEEISLQELIGTVTELVRPVAAKNGNELEGRCDDGLGTIVIDPKRLRQILLNLLSNACKFTKAGYVTLSAEPTEESGQPWVALSVRDTGIGISDEQKSDLFKPFSQADASSTREYGGTGLGLVICKRLVVLMGGAITLESKLGEGSTFTVRLPTKPPPRFG